MKLEDIEAFVAVVQHTSLTQAAQTLGLAQPLVSRRIQSLEETLGAMLLDRNSKPSRPTAIGMRVYAQCVAVLRETAALRDVVATAKPQGELRLGVTHSLGDHGMAAILASVAQRFPEMKLQTSAGWSADLVKRVAEGQTDAATVLFPAGKQFPIAINAEDLAQADIVLIAKKGSLTRSSYKLRDLYEQGWILNPDGCGLHAALHRALHDQGLPFNIACDAFGTDLQLELVANGMGIGVVPAALIQGSRHQDAIDVLKVSDFRPAIRLWLVHAAALGNLTLPVQSFGAAVKSRFDLQAA